VKITRRGVLLGVLGASSAALAYRRFPWEVALRSPMEDLLLRLLQVVAVPNPVLVGEAHLLAAPHLRNEPQSLLDSVFADLPTATAGGAENLVERLAAALRETARRQFETGDVMRVGGWILARVEVELCALIALDRRPGIPPGLRTDSR
jgi:hypothetical protein